MRATPLLRVAPLAADRVQEFDGARPYLATGDVGDEADIRPVSVTYAERPSRADLTVRPGDVCFARMAATRKVFEFTEDHHDVILSTGFAVLRPDKSKVHPGYVRHWLSTDQFQASKDRLSSGATQKAITNEKMSLLTIPLPESPDEQARIAGILDKAEALRAKRRDALARLDDLADSIFIHLFGDPIRNKRQWPLAMLADVARVERGRFTPRPRNDPRYYGGEFPFIQTGDISRCGGRLRSWSQTLNDEGRSVSRSFPAGTVVIAIVGATLGMTAILDVEVYCPDSVVGIQPDEKKASAEYIERVLRFWRPIFVEQAPETARANINLETLRPLKVPVPPISLQEAFSRYIERVEAVREGQRASLAAMDALVAALQHRAFRGVL